MNKVSAVLIGSLIGIGLSLVILPPNASSEQVRQVQEDMHVDLMAWSLIPAGLAFVYFWKKG